MSRLATPRNGLMMKPNFHFFLLLLYCLSLPACIFKFSFSGYFTAEEDDLSDKNNNSFLPIWPQGFSARLNDGIIEVVDENDQLIAQVDDNLRIGGGEMPGQSIRGYTLQPLPDNCPGPYWIVGDEITR